MSRSFKRKVASEASDALQERSDKRRDNRMARRHFRSLLERVHIVLEQSEVVVVVLGRDEGRAHTA